MRVRMRWLPFAAALAAALLFAVGCGDDESEGGGAAESGGSAELSGELGAAEDTEITVALPFPDVSMYSFYVVAKDMGYYEEEGLNVEIITADDVNAAIASGSADVGINSAGAVIEAIRNDIGVTILSGHFCRQNFDFAVQPEVQSVEDLDGKDVVLAGTTGDPAEFERARVLKEEGWDLDTIDANVVYPGPDSATWREFFLAKRVSLIPFYGDDRPALEEYGAKIVIETSRPWPNDVQLVAEDWLAENPNSAVRFLRATLKAVNFITAPGVGELPENKERVLEIYEANDLEVADLREVESPWVFDGHNTCENLYYGEEAWNTTIERQQLEPLEFNLDMGYLEKAQELEGLDNSPPKEISYP